MSADLELQIIGAPSVGVIDTFRFYAGEDRTLKLQVIDTVKNCSHSIPSGATKKLFLSGTPDDLEIADGDISVDSNDSSIFSVSLSDSDTKKLITGSIRFEYENSGITRIATKQFGLKKLT